MKVRFYADVYPHQCVPDAQIIAYTRLVTLKPMDGGKRVAFDVHLPDDLFMDRMASVDPSSVEVTDGKE